ncbi:oligosaccharide flippase family protein [Acidobacteria bacterium AH-259-G07]|nr:oligosaccharide flippase family protein [Acidobacteria bacterium AH-259-G07]
MRRSALIGYKTFSEILVRAFSFLIVVLAARLLIKEEFGIFSLAWTAGWIISVSTDFGRQLFLAGQVARYPEKAWNIFRHLLRVRISVSGGVLTVVVAACALSGWPRLQQGKKSSGSGNL